MAKERRSRTGAQTPDSTDDASLPRDLHADPDEGHGGYSSDHIAARAYELYLARGAADGQDFDDWIAAERELATGPSQGERSTESKGSERSE